MFAKILNTFGTRSLSAVINLLIAILLSQVLGPAGKGQQGLVITTITFILVFSNLVGGATLVYLTPRKEASQLLLPSYLWTILISLVSVPILLVFDLVDIHFVVHVCVLAALNSFATIHISMLIGKEKIVTSNLIGLIQPLLIILSLAIFFFVMEWRSIWAYVAGLYISFCFSLIVSYIYLFRLIGPIKFIPWNEFTAIMKEMFRYGILNQVAHITQMMSFRMSYYFLDRFHGESSVGVYSNGISLAESVWLIAKSISLVQYSRISNSEDRNYSQKLTVQLSKASAILSLVILVPLIFLPESFYVFIFGLGFSGVRHVIWSLSLGVVIYNFSILLGHYFSGTGRYQVNAIASSAGLVVSVILFYALIPIYNNVGAGIATSVSYFFTTVILLVYFIKDNPKNFRKSLSFRGDMATLRKEIRGMFKV